MKVRYLLNHVFGKGGTIATTIANANALAARGHDVEIASVTRRKDSGGFAVSPDVSVVFLSDARKGAADARDPDSLEPSAEAPADERRAGVYSRLTDRRIREYLAGATGVVVGTRPALNLQVARHATDAVRVGQEHLYVMRQQQAGRDQTMAAIRQWYPELDCIVTLTGRDAADYRSIVPATRVETIPNAVNTLSLGLTATTESHRVISAGRLTGQKGFDRLINSFALVARRFPDWRLEIYGSGPAEDSLQSLIDGSGAPSSIELMGFTSTLPALMADSGVLAMTSRYEGMPMVMLEAMGVGLPLVSFDFRSGPRDLIEEGENGFLVREGDEAGFAHALSRLMADPALRRRMGARSRDLAAGFRPDVIADRWESLFGELTATRSTVDPGSGTGSSRSEREA